MLSALLIPLLIAGSPRAQEGCAPHIVRGQVRSCVCALTPEDLGECCDGDETACSYIAGCLERDLGPSPAILPAVREDLAALAGPLDPADAEVALLAAVRTGRVEAVALLLARGVPAEAARERFGSALELAVGNPGPALELATLLLRAGADPNRRIGQLHPLVVATLRGDRELVRLLLQAGADPDAPSGHEGTTALMTAAARGDVEVIRVLLAAMPDPGRPSHGVTAAASLARRRGHEEAAALLEAAAAPAP